VSSGSSWLSKAGREGAVESPPDAGELDDDPQMRQRELHRAHEAFLTLGVGVDPARGAVRPIVLESWQRALSLGVDPERADVPVELLAEDLQSRRASHPLNDVIHIIRRLLSDDAEDAGHLMAVTDATGVLLWVEGAHALRSKAEVMNFVEGARWSEDCAGTNAPGTALALDRPVQVFASEHFSRIVQPWTCSAAPIHDPATGELLGVVDLTGGHHIGSPHARALVGATVAAVESELRLTIFTRNAPVEVGPTARRPDKTRAGATAATRLEVLGREDAALSSRAGTIRLSQRHAELLLLIMTHPGGLSVEQLSSLLSESESAPVTIRAEMSRLRQHLGAGFISSRPYRIAVDLASDFDEVRRLIGRGSLRRALAAYAGPVLPRSTAPGIVELREDLRAELRRALLQTTQADLLFTYAQTPDGWDDAELWERCLTLLPRTSPRRATVAARLQRLAAADPMALRRHLWVPPVRAT
jgi:transcriptional regulator of acetoin/glycerol metabolism